MTRHRLDALLEPSSIAIVGASDKPGSNGHASISMCGVDGYAGTIYPVNPRLSRIEGMVCYPDLLALPKVPEHVVIGVASRYVEAVVDQAISLGVKAASIFAACHLTEDASPRLPERIASKAKGAGMQICGANCMGFYHPGAGLRVASVQSPPRIRTGGIAWIAQSGSAFGALSHNDRRLGFSLCVSTGMELVTTVADYMEWSLGRPDTRVIGLFLETVRDPVQFVRCLQTARDRQIPVVVLKVGRTEKSAKMAVSHTGAIAGNDAAFGAVIRRYGATRVFDMDEMAATLAFFDSPRRAAPGLLGTVHDSGGERELTVDLADDIGLSFANLNAETCAALCRHLEPGLHAENPLDAYATSSDVKNRFAALTTILVNDPNVALGLFMSDPRDNYGYAQDYTAAVLEAAPQTDKPLALVSNYSLADDRGLAQTLAQAGIPLLRGTRNALLAAKHLMAFRDYRSESHDCRIDRLAMADRWKARLSSLQYLNESEALAMLSEFGIATPQLMLVHRHSEIDNALESLTFPVVLKTAENHAHKSDVGGVVLNIHNRDAAHEAYRAMAGALGPSALLMEMVPKGTELALGAFWDDSFGPVVLVAAGGIHIEVLNDQAVALAPFSQAEARRLIGSLRIAKLLRGMRGQAAVDLDALAQQVARFSQMVANLGDALGEIDVNPLICTAQGTFAVDCLAVGRGRPDLERASIGF